MNPLIYLVVVGSASAGLALWQQAFLGRVQKDIARISAELVDTRNAIETDRVSLAEVRGRLGRLRGEFRGANTDPAAALPTDGLTPEREGWWPRDQPYFYLPKSYLPQVRFRKCRLPITKVNALMTKRYAALNPSVISVSVQPDSDGLGAFEYRLFEGGMLNRDMAVLLGMNEGEVARTDELFAGLIGAVREMEVARIEPVNPPEPAGNGITNQWIVARMPELEVEPLVDAFANELDQLLGASRRKVLLDQIDQYFVEHADRLGAVSREFIRQGDALIVQYMEPSGRRQRDRTPVVPTTREMEYGHIFGPGAPCELK